MTWHLTVRYPVLGGHVTHPQAYRWGELDAAIWKAAGKCEAHRGTDVVTGHRFLVYQYSTEVSARNARRRVLGLRRRGVRTEVKRG